MFSAGFGPSSFAVIAPRCAAPQKIRIDVCCCASPPPPFAFISHGIAEEHLCFSYRFASINFMCYFWNVSGFQAEEESADMFYTCGPNEAMVVSGKVLAVPSLSVAVYCHSYYRSKYTNAHRIKHLLKFVQADFRTYLVSFPAGLCRSPPLMIAGGRVFVIPCIQQIQRLAFKLVN